MKSMIDYVKEYGNYTFTQKTINEVDSLILCQIAYFKLDGLVPGFEDNLPCVTLEYLYENADFDKLFVDDWYKEENLLLFHALAVTERFRKLRMNYYINIINTEHETQFAAVTYILENKSVYLAYRGTDETIVGWKEDFNLALSQPVHSQLLSVEYMEKAAGNLAGNFYVGGHSKGGNLAVYASMNCHEDIQKRILGVYNNDGPGFRPEVCEEGHYERIAKRTVKFIPRSSLIGMIMESHTDYEVVESGSFGVMQHNPFSWEVEGDGFVRAKRSDSRVMDNTMNEWILSMTDEEIHSFVDTLYSVITASGAKSLIEFTSDFNQNMKMVRKAMKDVDGETKKMIWKIIRSFFVHAGHEIKEKAEEKSQIVQRKRKKAVEETV